MIDPLSLVSIAATFFVVAVSPGPATLSNAVVAMQYGRRAGLRYGVGLTAGLAFWGVVAASGMGVVLQSSVVLLSALKVLGGLYLLWLAWRSAWTAWQPDTEHTLRPTRQRWFVQGLALNLSNPKAVLAWMAALSLGLEADAGLGALAAATAACVAMGLLVYVLIALVFSVGGVMHGYRRFRRWIEGITAGAFAVAGVGLIRSSFVEAR
ncbi:MAG: LysE family transporter [Pseudomonadota bacterium]